MTRNEEKKLCAKLAAAADALAQPGLNYAELYIGRVQLTQALRELIEASERSGARLTALENVP